MSDGQTLPDPLHADASKIAIGCWRGRTNISVMITAIDCQELQERLLLRMEAEKGSLLQENKDSSEADRQCSESESYKN
ncbi:unnamed protein product [Ilex paraguariensis]|uniref:RNA cytosine-C(5)-methyltransferase NSUN2-like PUA domain-containing protein n=1 Tax=Ilex paraguariensis TaxID=185542 RepID=A0ABC8T1H4_9AQUA